MRFLPRALPPALAALALCIIAAPAPAQVKSHAKISDAHGFTGVLDENERFGIGVTALGDLDGDTVTDLAVGAYFDGYHADSTGVVYQGAAYVLFMNVDGTVKSFVKIAAGSGGFAGSLDNADEFGVSVAAIGDLDDDGVVDLAIGARLDDDAASGPNHGVNRGAIWIVFLNADGTVKHEQKISAFAGGFTGALDDGDWFGAFVTAVGDLDGDGVEDIVGGTPFDDDGGPDQGALWVLFLNSDGTVKSHQKISGQSGGLTAGLETGDRFGTGPGNLGDIDGDGVVDLATGALMDDDGGEDFGAVYLLYLNSNGTVKSHAKISATSGGFTGQLSTGCGFGSMCVLAQPGNATQRVAVSAKTDDQGGYRRGAVWLLDVQPDGTVTQHVKIGSGSGGFAGALSNGDEFGLGLASLGDFDGDGNHDLAVGARLDDDSMAGYYEDAGAVWLLFLGTCDLSATPASVDFGTVALGESADAQFVLQNNGIAPVSGTIAESCSRFAIVAGGGPFTLGPGDTLSVTVRFTPTSTVTSFCTVTTGAACGSVTLSGTGGALPPEPAIVSIRDVPNDQGRRVRITFAPSGYDRSYAPYPIETYEIYRRIDVEAAAAPAAAPAGERRALLDGWDYVTAVPAHGENEYNLIVGTLADSTLTRGMHWSVFLVRATSYSPLVFFDSAADSGYSLDNTPPAAPQNLVVSYAAAGNVLRWAPSASRDLLGYRVYRAGDSTVPAARDAVALTRDTEWTDPVRGAGYYYRVAAVDSAGNESDAIAPGRSDGALPLQLALRQNEPNPFNPSTTIRYDVPAPGGRVTMRVYDVHGRLVRSLVDRDEAPGARAVTWDGRNNAGSRVATGTYFCRLESGGQVLTRKMTLLE